MTEDIRVMAVFKINKTISLEFQGCFVTVTISSPKRVSHLFTQRNCGRQLDRPEQGKDNGPSTESQ